jgi:hypothetical protein
MKIRLFNLLWIYCSVCICLAFLTQSVWAASYTFTRIMDVTDYDYAIEPPMINNQGTVYFRAMEDFLGSMLLYVKPYYQTMSTYIWIHGTVEHAVYEPVMNDCSQVAFRWDTADGIAMARLPGSPTEMVLSSYLDHIAAMGNVNNSGHIVFKGRDNTKDGLYKCAAPLTVELIVQEDATTKDLDCPCINNNGEIAYKATLENDETQVRTSSVVFAETNGDFQLIGCPSINDSGSVAFYGMKVIPDPPYVICGIYKCSGAAQCSTYVDDLNDGILPDQSYFPDINNHGQVAYLGALSGIGAAILTGPESTTDKVIAVGDTLDGSTVASLSVRQLNGHFFNDYGQVAFSATLANGHHGFYRADPEGLVLPRSCPSCPAIYLLLFSETP